MRIRRTGIDYVLLARYMADSVAYRSRAFTRLERVGERFNGVQQAFGRMNPKNQRALLVLIGIVVIAVAVTVWWYTHTGNSSSFATVPVQRGNVTASITAAGTIEPLEVVDVGAQVAGQIRAFGTDKAGKPIDYRSIVAAGDVLATIDES